MNGTSFVEESFFVGGSWVADDAGEHALQGQMYVSHRVPAGGGSGVPLVLVHGASSTGTTFETTPDGRPGMAELFLRRGRAVYVVDQPARGRSAYWAEADGAVVADTAERMERMCTASAEFGLWPEAVLHTQFPGSGRRGDPVFDAFYAGLIGHAPSFERTEALFRDAGASLLDRIGPAVLVTHSQAGRLGWHVADAGPELVRAVVALEPNGPPFYERSDPDGKAAPARPYGLTSLPLAFDPPLGTGEPLPHVRRPGPDARADVPDFIQPAPARQLANLRRVPVLVVTGEASYHARYEGLTVDFLRTAGVDVEHAKLGERGIHGNGHLLPIELNNDRIVDLITDWLVSRGV